MFNSLVYRPSVSRVSHNFILFLYSQLCIKRPTQKLLLLN